MDPQRLRNAMPAELIQLDAPAPASKQALFEQIADLMQSQRRVTNAAAYVEALEARENQGSTFMGEGLAIPHGLSDTVTQPSIAYVRLASPFAYESAGDGGDVTHIFALAVPDGGAGDHLAALAFLARGLLDDSLRARLETASAPEDVVDAFTELAQRETTS